MKDELGWGDTLPGVKCPWEQDTMPTVSCPQGQDKPLGGGGILPRGKVSPGTRYRGDKINRYTGLNLPNFTNCSFHNSMERHVTQC